MARTLVKRDDLPTGQTVLYYYDPDTGQQDSITVGTAIDPVQRAQQAGQVAAAQTRATYDDPWYIQNVIDPMNRSTEQAAQDRATALKNQAKQLALQGRTAEANILNSKAQVELRKMELKQSGYFQQQGQQLQAAGMMSNLRGFGNAAQALDLGRRTAGFGTQTGALADIAAGRVPQGAFGFKPGQNPVSMADRMSGMLGASQDQMNVRDANDRSLAQQIASRAGQLPRGSLESLAPEELDYLGSYTDATGDWQSTKNRYAAAGIQQGRRG